MGTARIAVAGILHESNTFSTLRTDLGCFRVARGAEVLEARPIGEHADVEWLPALLAYASPHGMVTRDAYEMLRDELLDRLAASLPVDGVFLALHGAMEVEGIGDGETDLVRRVREVVGADIPIAASLDLHANLAPFVAEHTDVLTAYRTAPHIDEEETRERAVRHLLRCAREGLRPANALVKLPLLLPGEYAVTDVEPARSLYASLAEIEREPGVLDASILIGCAWTDSPFSSVSALVVAESDAAVARTHAEALADRVWEKRAEFGPDTETLPLDESIARAVSSLERPFVIADSGDNPGAGGAGDLPLVLAALLEAGADDAVVGGIAAPAAVAECVRAGVGATVRLTVGGKLDTVNAKPLPLEGVVEYAQEGGEAVVRCGGVRVMLLSARWAVDHPDAYRRVGIDPTAHQVVVVKSGFLSPGMRSIAKADVMALTPGFTSLDLARLPYRNLTRPIHPLDEVSAYGGETRARL